MITYLEEEEQVGRLERAARRLLVPRLHVLHLLEEVVHAGRHQRVQHDHRGLHLEVAVQQQQQQPARVKPSKSKK